MFAYCQWCRKSPSPSTLVASNISSASFEEGKKKTKRKNCLIASRSLPSLTGPQGQPHYTVVKSEVIQYKVKTKTFSKKHKRLVEWRVEIAVLEESHQEPIGGCAQGDEKQHY